MFPFFKKLFKKKREVPRNELWSVLDKEVREREQKVRTALHSANTRINELIDSIHILCDHLGKDTLQNSKISKREKQFMEGNRKAYARSIKHYLIKIPVFEWPVFYDQQKIFLENTRTFITQSGRQKQILTQFFAHRVKEIDAQLKSVGEEIARVDALILDLKLQKLQNINQRKDDQNDRNRQIDEYQQKLNELLQRNTELKEKNTQRLETIRAIRESNEFTEHRDEGERLTVEINRARQKIVDHFTHLKSTFRKYAKMATEHEDLISKYAEDPIEALSSDFTLDILTICDRINDNLPSLGLKQEKEQKVRRALSKVTKDSASQLQHELAQVTKEYSKYLRLSSTKPFLQKIQILKEEIEQDGKIIENIEGQVDSLTKSIAQLRAKDEYEQLVSECRQVLNVTLV